MKYLYSYVKYLLLYVSVYTVLIVHNLESTPPPPVLNKPEHHFLPPTTELNNSVTVCGQNETSCNNGDCISISFLCDGWSDCEDEEDEANCTRASRRKGEYDEGRLVHLTDRVHQSGR